MAHAEFEIVPGLRLSVSGRDGDVDHFVREYGAFRAGADTPAASTIAVEFATSAKVAGEGVWTDGHKTVGWMAALASADREARVDIALSGWPRSFARSLVQGFVVEPLQSVLAAERGHVQLPAAGIVDGRGLHVLIGRSRAGKSTLAARALAGGDQIIGDDQVLATARDGWRPFPRRLRFYPDIRDTAPLVWRRLAPGTRAQLTVRRSIAIATRGFVRPSLAVDIAELGGRWDPRPREAARIVLLERSGDVDSVQSEGADVAAALDWATTILAEQRARFARALAGDWRARLTEAATHERTILAQAIGATPVERVRIPDDWSAPRAIGAAAIALGFSS